MGRHRLPKFLAPNDPRRTPTLACPLLSRGVNAVESPCRETHSDLHEVVVRRLLNRLDVSTVFFPNDGRRLDVCEVVLWITGLVGPNVGFVFARQSLDRPHLDEVLVRRPRVGLDMDKVFFFDLLLCEDVDDVAAFRFLDSEDVDEILLLAGLTDRDVDLVFFSDSLGGANVDKVARPNLGDHKVLNLHAGL